MKTLTKWAAAPLLALGLLAGGAAMATAATTGNGSINPTIAPGGTGVTGYEVSTEAQTDQTSNLDVVWNAPPNSVFTNNQLGWDAVRAGASFPNSPQWSANGCTLSNGNKTLTCNARSVTIPGRNGASSASYGRLMANLTADPAAAYNSQYRGELSFTSNNGQISSIASGPTPGFNTPPEPGAPLIDPIVGLGAGTLALGTGALVLMNRRRSVDTAV